MDRPHRRVAEVQRYAEHGAHRLVTPSDAEDDSGIEEFIELAGTKLIARA